MQDLKKIILPYLKGLPFIVAVLLLSILIALRLIYLTNPLYESVVKIKLDDKSLGMGNSNLYKDFDYFTSSNKISAEIEILKSNFLIEKTIKNIDWQISYYRNGDFRTTELLKNSPFVILKKDKSYFKKTILVSLIFLTEDSVQISWEGGVNKLSFDDTFIVGNDTLVLKKNTTAFTTKQALNISGAFSFSLNDVKTLTTSIVLPSLDVTSVDNDVPIVRISLKHQLPFKAQEFVDQLAKEYIKDYVEDKNSIATETISFINERLEEIGDKLISSEKAIEEFKKSYKIVNTRQETETGLKQTSQIEIQLINLELESTAIDAVESYVSSKKNFLKAAPSYLEFSGALYNGMIENIKNSQATIEKLKMKYNENHPKVKVEKEIIDQNVEYIKEAIKQSRISIHKKKEKLLEELNLAHGKFVHLPKLEKDLLRLERAFNLNQKTYNFLSEKKVESNIAAASSMSFHRIIQFGSLPKKPVSPNKTLILFVSSFLGMLIGVGGIWLKKYVNSYIEDRSDYESLSNVEVVGVIPKIEDLNANNESFLPIVNLIISKFLSDGSLTIAITSAVSNEGKTFIANGVAKALRDLDYPVTLIDLNTYNPTISNNNDLYGRTGWTNYETKTVYSAPFKIISSGTHKLSFSEIIGNHEFEERWKEMTSINAITIIDTPASIYCMDVSKVLSASELVINVVRANFTKQDYVIQADLLKERYGLKNIYTIINCVNNTINASGDFIGSRFSYSEKKNVVNRLIDYYRTYVRK